MTIAGDERVPDQAMTATHNGNEIEGGPELQVIDGVEVPLTMASVVEALTRALELHDYRRGSFGETSAHIARVTRLAQALAERVAPELAADPRLAAGFRLHDIGMIGIPVQVLAKQGPLSPDELHEVREHPWLGERIVAPIESLNGVARQVIGFHHERWDGSGYPRGIQGAEIPLAARVFAVVDAWDSMTNAQPYREAFTPEAALAELGEGAGSHFDPALVAVFAAMHGELAAEAAV
jgi:HD-GYP domain-containing protein (c-di-GMP phosphodiesterase class II)